MARISILPLAAMTARINTDAFQGVDALGIDVQVRMSAGLPAFTKSGETNR